MKLIRYAALIGAVVVAPFAVALDTKPFSTKAAYQSLKISPSGDYYAATFPYKDHRRLAILNAKDFSVECQFFFRDSESIGSFWWANDERVLMTITKEIGQFDAPAWTGELFGGNADCSKKEQLFGFRNGQRSGASIESLMFDDPKHVLISSNEEKAQFSNLYKMNVYNGRRTLVEKSDFSNNSIILDRNDDWRVVTSYETERKGIAKAQAKGVSTTYYRKDVDSEWQKLSQLNHIRDSKAGTMSVVGFDENNVDLIVRDNTKRSQVGIYRYTVADGSLEPLFEHDTFDANVMTDISHAENGKRVRSYVGAVVSNGKPETHFFDEKSYFATAYRGLEQAFSGQRVYVTSKTRDNKTWVVYVSSDRNPGEYYLYKPNKGQVTYLMKTNPLVDPKKMASMKAVSFKARDGLEIHGLLTIPAGKEAKDLPLILHPHGGPYGIVDRWGFNPEVQMYAAAGYAVLQVNFRGSGGYGREFEDLGYGQWGGAMQDDLTDATLWAVEQGIADKERLCISGASYGGYASLMGVVKEPDLYKCAIGYVGVYDLNLMMDKGNVSERIGWGKNYMTQAFGATEAERASRSPAEFADKIKAGIFLVHGGKDLQAHYDNAYVMADALKKAGKPYEWMFKKGEGHGFYDDDNREELYQKMVTFLDKHIGENAK